MKLKWLLLGMFQRIWLKYDIRFSLFRPPHLSANRYSIWILFFSLCNAKNEEKANLAIYLIKLQRCLLDYHKKRLPCHFFLQVRWKSKISMIHWKWKKIAALKVKRLISNTLSLGINLRHETYKNTNENHSFERKMRSIRLIYDYIWCVSHRRTVKLITAISIFIKQWCAKKSVTHAHRS